MNTDKHIRFWILDSGFCIYFKILKNLIDKKSIQNSLLKNLYLSLFIGGCISFFSLSILAQTNLAPTPPMGWNSWDSYGVSVTEAEVKATANYMAKNLKQFGWKYIVVDAQWYDPDSKLGGKFESNNLASDEFGRLLPDTKKFPSAANGKGFKPLADYIHKLGLKFGIHIMRGIPRQAVRKNLPVYGTNVHAQDIADQTSICKWNKDMYGVDTTKPNAQGYYDSIIKLYADWGIDYLKADDISSPFREGEIAAIHNAINKSGRKIVLSLSPGPAPPESLGMKLRNIAIRNSQKIRESLADFRRFLGSLGGC